MQDNILKKEKQWPCKPGSVHSTGKMHKARRVLPSVIYPLPVSPPVSIVLPSGSDGQPSRHGPA